MKLVSVKKKAFAEFSTDSLYHSLTGRGFFVAEM